MEEYLKKLQEYCSYVSGSWFTLEIMSHNVGVLKYYYPGQVEVKTVWVFDTLEEFLSSNCKDILSFSEFVKVSDKY